MRRTERKAQTRSILIETARTSFEDIGYDATTMRILAQKAGYSTGAVFAHFDDKAQIYEAVFGHPPVTAEQGRALLLAARSDDAAASRRLADQIASEHAVAAKDAEPSAAD